MAQKYAIGAQASGFVSFRVPITDASDYGAGTDHLLNIPPGMICIGDNGRGFVIEEQSSTNPGGANPLDINNINSVGTYVLYASLPDVTTPGIAKIDATSYQDYTSYTGGVNKKVYEGDGTGRKAIAIFRVRYDGSKYKIDPTSIRTLATFDYEELLQFLKEYGIFAHSTDEAFIYRGQNIIPDITLEASVIDNDLVYYNGTNYDQALADDTEKEIIIGLIDRDRDGVIGKNYVITSGVVDVGTGKLPDGIFPANTYLYLSNTVAGGIVRDFDPRLNSESYVLTDTVIGTGASSIDYVLTCYDPGTSDVSLPGAIGTITTIWKPGDTFISGVNGATDGSVNWYATARHDPSFIGPRTIRIGVSLGNGVLLLNANSSSAGMDDHSDSSHAHQDIQDAMERAGLYVLNEYQGKNTWIYRGQYFDKDAGFSGIADNGQFLVYLDVDGLYKKADHEANAVEGGKENIIGVSYGVATNVGSVVSSGFFTFDVYNDIDNTATPGDRLFLHTTVPGTMTLTDTGFRVGSVITVGDATTEGVIKLDVTGANELEDHNEDPFAHSDIRTDIALGAGSISSTNINSLNREAESKRDEFAGSGFVNWGKNPDQAGNYPKINEGLYADALGGLGVLKFARYSTTAIGGESDTYYPTLSCNGQIIRLEQSNTSNTSNRGLINLPVAPTVLRDDATTTTLPAKKGDFIFNSVTDKAYFCIQDSDAGVALTTTANYAEVKHIARTNFCFVEVWHERISTDSGVDGFKDIVYPYGNIQYGLTTWEGITLNNNETLSGTVGGRATYSRSFDGDTITTGSELVTNGDFPTDTTSWAGVNATLSVAAGALRVTNDSAAAGYAWQRITVTVGDEYELAWDGIKSSAASDSKINKIAFFDTGGSEIKTQVATTVNTTDGTYALSMRAIMTETQVDIRVYSGDATTAHYMDYDNISVKKVKSNSIGYGATWSTLTQDEKNTFSSDPQNNLFRDGVDGNDKPIFAQVRYRLRVVSAPYDNTVNAGYADWISEMRATKEGATNLRYYSSTTETIYPLPWGQKSDKPDFYHANTIGKYETKTDVDNSLLDSVEQGVWLARTSAGADDTAIASNGKAWAMPLAMIRQGNQGGFHPTYNPKGYARFFDDATGTSHEMWHAGIAGSYDPDLKRKCHWLGATGGAEVFINNSTGALGDAVSGRTDGKYFDVVYEEDVEDLRMSAVAQDNIYNEETLTEMLMKYANDEYRGNENEFYMDYNAGTPQIENMGKQKTHLWCDVITNTASDWKTSWQSATHPRFGYWRSVDPATLDNSGTPFTLSRKLKGADSTVVIIRYVDDDVTAGTVLTLTTDYTITNNIVDFVDTTAYASTDKIEIWYEAEASTFEDSSTDTQTPLGVSKVLVSCHPDDKLLIDNFHTSEVAGSSASFKFPNTTTDAGKTWTGSVSSYETDFTTKTLKDGYTITHPTVTVHNLDDATHASAFCKSVAILHENVDGQLEIFVHYKELIDDASSQFGDNDEILVKTSTPTSMADINANNVEYGRWKWSLPYFHKTRR